MATQAGSLLGLVDGMGKGVGTAAALEFSTTIKAHFGDPTDILTGNVGSDIVHDVTNNDFYICIAQGGSDWNRLISGT